MSSLKQTCAPPALTERQLQFLGSNASPAKTMQETWRQRKPGCHSSGNPLLPRTPASEHAARWWPRESSWRPHRQVREGRGNESPRRLRRTTLNNWGSIFVILCVGTAVEEMKQGARSWQNFVERPTSLVLPPKLWPVWLRIVPHRIQILREKSARGHLKPCVSTSVRNCGKITLYP